MAKVSDKIAICISAAVLLYIAGAYITNSYLLGGVFALLGAGATIAWDKLRPRHTKGVSYTDFVNDMLLEGKAKSNEYLRRLYPVGEEDGEDAYYDQKGNYIVNAIGYSKVGEEWAAKIYRKLKGKRPQMVVATMDIDRKALSILSRVATDVKILRPKEMLRRLGKVGVQPEGKPAKTRLGWKVWLSALSYRHALLFAMTAGGCLVMSIWLPVKIYYYVFASINAALCLAVLVIKKATKE